MIEPQDISIKAGEIVTLANGVKLIVFTISGSRPSAMTIRSESSEIKIADFAGGRFSRDVNCLVPTVEVVIWKNQAFIIGLQSVVIAGGGTLVKCDLFRKADEDSGFYKTDWVDAEQRIFCIYESGIVAWNDAGEVLWHVRKFWDDVFVGIEAEGFVFVMHDDQRILVDQSDGSRSTPPNLPPP